MRDAFTGTNGTFLESHAPDTGGAWTRIQGQGLRLQGGEITPDKTNGTDRYTNAAVPPSAEYTVGITASFISANADNYVELLARITGGNGYVAYVNAQSSYAIIRYVSGVPTVLASGTTTALNVGLASDNEIVFSVTDASKRLSINGTLVATVTDNTITAAGRAGLGLQVRTKDDSFADTFYASTLAPTAVEMDSMGAIRDGGSTLVTWTTGRAVGNLGYRVWRVSNGERVCITPQPIAGSTFFVNAASSTGSTYRWLDDAAADEYWIEEIDLRGAREWHGPIAPASGRIAETTVPAPKLSELAQRSGVKRGFTRERLRANAAAPAAGYNFELAAHEALKIAVTTPGIHELPIPAGADRDALRLWEEGRELPIVVTPTAIRFYGTPLDTPASGTRVYWLTWQQGRGARTVAEPMSAAPMHDASGFLATVELREKSIFAATLQSEDGDGFFGPVITNDPALPAKQTVRLADVDRSAATAELALTVQGATLGAHRIAVTLNGHAAGTIDFEGQARQHATFTVDTAWLRDGANEVVLLAQNGSEDVSAVEAVRVTYARKYVLADGALLFTAPGGTRVRLGGAGGKQLVAFDITDPEAPRQLAAAADVVDVRGPGVRTVAVAAKVLAPAGVEQNLPTMVHALKHGAFAIVAPRAMLQALAPLAARREDAALLAVEEIYDEFSFGAKDPAAIRAFASVTRPRAILLAGDGSYDPRDHVGGGAADVIPVKLVDTALQRTPSDAWFTDFDDDGIADIAIGRLPARTSGELQAMVAKIVAYETGDAATGDVVFVSGSGAFEGHRSALTTAHIDVDAEGVVAARQNLLQTWSNGAGIIDFVGHGSVEMWESAGFFARADAASAGDGAPLPLVIAMTCLNGYFHDLAQESLAEALLRNEDGGAAAVWALSTLTETSGQVPANEALLATLSSGRTLGQATIAAQRATADPDVRRTLLLFGDPTMKLRGTRTPIRRRAVR
ncbi:MAG TPA: C25 family cysteine peptidase [Thermoanaerobaculia bacterium]